MITSLKNLRMMKKGIIPVNILVLEKGTDVSHINHQGNLNLTEDIKKEIQMIRL